MSRLVESDVMRGVMALTIGLLVVWVPGTLRGEESLEELLEYAEDHAPELLEARERLGLGQAAVAGAEKLQPFNPQVTGELGLGLPEGEFRSLEATVKQRLEVAGERGRRIEAARRRKTTLARRVERARWKVRQRVRRLYRLGLVARRRLDLERQILDFTRQLLEVARSRHEAGETSRTSVVVSRAELATARRQVVQYRTAYIETLRELGTAIGWRDATPPRPAGKLDEPEAVPPKQTLLDQAFENDPQLALLEARLAYAQSKLDLAKREVWPNPILGAGLTRRNIGTSATTDKLRLIVGLPLPLWDHNQGEIADARARVRIVRQQIENRKTVLENRIYKRAETVEAAYRQTRIYQRDILPALEEQFDLLQEGFELGEMSLLDVMNARDRLLKVQRQNLTALQEYVRALSDLEKVLGSSL